MLVIVEMVIGLGGLQILSVCQLRINLQFYNKDDKHFATIKCHALIAFLQHS